MIAGKEPALQQLPTGSGYPTPCSAPAFAVMAQLGDDGRGIPAAFSSESSFHSELGQIRFRTRNIQCVVTRYAGYVEAMDQPLYKNPKPTCTVEVAEERFLGSPKPAKLQTQLTLSRETELVLVFIYNYIPSWIYILQYL